MNILVKILIFLAGMLAGIGLCKYAVENPGKSPVKSKPWNDDSDKTSSTEVKDES